MSSPRPALIFAGEPLAGRAQLDDATDDSCLVSIDSSDDVRPLAVRPEISTLS
jgi:hypothetical protein